MHHGIGHMGEDVLGGRKSWSGGGCPGHGEGMSNPLDTTTPTLLDPQIPPSPWIPPPARHHHHPLDTTPEAENQEIQSMSGWYASYWNAFLLRIKLLVVSGTQCNHNGPLSLSDTL